MKKLMFAALGATALALTGIVQAQDITDLTEDKDVTAPAKPQTVPVPVVPKTAVPMPGAAPAKPSEPALPTAKPNAPMSMEDQERLFSLYEENPAAYFEELRKITAEMRKRDQELNSKVMFAVTQYHRAQTPQEKAKYLKEVTDLTRQQYMIRSADSERRLKDALKRLQELNKIHEFRKKHAEEIIARRVEDITRSPGLKW